MPVTAADIVFYASANMPEDDTGTSGGAIDTLTIISLTADIAATDQVEALSSSAADTMNLTVTGRNAAGEIVSETKALTGVTPITFTTLGAIERFMKALLASAAAGTVTIRRATGDTEIVVIPIGVTQARRLFYDSVSLETPEDRYEKGFIKNTHATLSVTNAEVTLTTDPPGKYRVGCAPTADDTASVANRLALPASVTFVDDDVAQGVPGGSLGPGVAIGVWVHQGLGAGDAAHKAVLSVQLSGAST